jgi:hypothetical protein
MLGTNAVTFQSAWKQLKLSLGNSLCPAAKKAYKIKHNFHTYIVSKNSCLYWITLVLKVLWYFFSTPPWHIWDFVINLSILFKKERKKEINIIIIQPNSIKIQYQFLKTQDDQQCNLFCHIKNCTTVLM